MALVLPTAKVAVLKLAMVAPPIVRTLTGLPTLLPSIWNWTVPVGVPAAGAVMVMVAVKVMFWPVIDGLMVDATAVLVPLLLTVCVAVRVLPLAALSPSPLALAVIVPVGIASVL